MTGSSGRTSLTANPLAAQKASKSGSVRGQVISTKAMELARNFLSALFMGVRTAQLHDPSNKAFENAVRSVRDTAQALVTATGGFSIQFVEDSAFLNGARIRFEGGVFESMRKLRAILETKDLGGIEMQSVPNVAAVQSLLLLFAPAAGKEAEASKTELAGQQINILGVQKFADGNKGLKIDRRLFAAQCYAKLILALREQFERAAAAASGEVIRAPRLRAVRVVQDLVELCSDRMDFLLKLGMNRTGASRDEVHGANTAVLSIAMGHAMGIVRQDLVDIGMAALFHRVSAVETTGSEAERERSRAAFGRLLNAGRSGRSGWLRAVIAAEQGVIAGEQLPWGAARPTAHAYSRIVGVASGYARLTLGIDVRAPLEPLDALGRMLRDQKGRWDQSLVDLLINLLRSYPVGCEVRLDNGEHAVVKSQIAGSRWDRPIVAIGDPPRRLDLMRQDQGRFLARIVETVYPPENPVQHFGEPEITAEEDIPLVVPVDNAELGDVVALPLDETVTKPAADLDLSDRTQPAMDTGDLSIDDAPFRFDSVQPGPEVALDLVLAPPAPSVPPEDDDRSFVEPGPPTLELELEPLAPMPDDRSAPSEGIELELDLDPTPTPSKQQTGDLEPFHAAKPERTDPMLRPPESLRSVPASPPPAAFLGRYQIENEGSAAKGLVRGWDLRDGSDVRIKQVDLSVYSPEVRDEAKNAFEREARAAGLIAHPGLPRLIDSGIEGSRCCLVYEPGWGEPLVRLFPPGAPIPAIRARRIVRGLAEALHHLHLHGLVHQDVRAASVLVAAGDRASFAALDRVGPIERGHYDERAEQRALGLLLGELIGAKSKARGADDPLLADLIEIAERMSEIDPSKRFPSCEAVAIRLTRVK